MFESVVVDVVVVVAVVVVEDVAAEVVESFLQASIKIGPAATAVTNAFKKSLRSISYRFSDIKVQKRFIPKRFVSLNKRYVPMEGAKR